MAAVVAADKETLLPPALIVSGLPSSLVGLAPPDCAAPGGWSARTEDPPEDALPTPCTEDPDGAGESGNKTDDAGCDLGSGSCVARYKVDGGFRPIGTSGGGGRLRS